MIFYFDENFTPNLPNALHQLERQNDDFNIKSTSEVFGKGVPDEELIPEIGKEKGILVTKDKKMSKLQAQFALLTQHSVSTFFVTQAQTGYWDQVHLILKKWTSIRQIVKKESRKEWPTFYRVKGKGELEKMNK